MQEGKVVRAPGAEGAGPGDAGGRAGPGRAGAAWRSDSQCQDAGARPARGTTACVPDMSLHGSEPQRLRAVLEAACELGGRGAADGEPPRAPGTAASPEPTQVASPSTRKGKSMTTAACPGGRRPTRSQRATGECLGLAALWSLR